MGRSSGASAAGALSLAVNTSIPAGNTVANSTSETNFASKRTLSANSLSVGQVIRVTAYGIYGTDAISAGTITLKLKVGSTDLATSGALTNIVGLANRGWTLNALAVVTAIGASGAIETQGWAALSTAVNTATVADLETTAATSVDTTVSLDIQISVTLSVADTDNTIQLRQLLVEVLG